MAKNIQNLLRDGRVDKDATKEIYHLDESKAPDIVSEIKSGDVLLADGHIYVLISQDGIKEVVIGNSSDTYDSAFKVSASSDEPTTVSWDNIEDKPETFAPTIGTTEDTAKAGDWTPPAGDIPNLPTSKITSGTFADARIPNLAISKITGLQGELDSKADSTDIPDVSGFATNAGLTSGLELKVDKETGKGLSEDNFTTDEKLKLAGLESPKFKGQFLSLADLTSADVGEVGGYAYVDGGVGGTVDLYIWDAVNSLWEVVAGESTAETPASIKSKYESNPDTNVLTDTEKQALNNILIGDRFSLKRLGTWNASTNTPELLQGEGTRGDYRVVTTPGSYNFGNGVVNFNYGDWVIFTGGIWHKIVTSDSTVNWSDVQNKPNLPASPRGNISSAIPALRKGLNSPQSIPASTNTRISTWGAGYDQFNIEDTNGVFVIPEWASYARVTCTAILDYLQVGRIFHLELRLNTTSTANSVCTGVGTSKKPTVLIDTGIMPVNPGDEFSAVVWHNADTAKPLESGARTMINIELFETI